MNGSGSWAEGRRAADASDGAALLRDARVARTLLQDEFFGELRDLARFETPKKIGLIAEPFSVEDGTLTPTQKVRRTAVTAKYADLIESFYLSRVRPEQTMFTP